MRSGVQYDGSRQRTVFRWCARKAFNGYRQESEFRHTCNRTHLVTISFTRSRKAALQSPHVMEGSSVPNVTSILVPDSSGKKFDRGKLLSEYN